MQPPHLGNWKAWPQSQPLWDKIQITHWQRPSVQLIWDFVQNIFRAVDLPPSRWFTSPLRGSSIPESLLPHPQLKTHLLWRWTPKAQKGFLHLCWVPERAWILDRFPPAPEVMSHHLLGQRPITLFQDPQIFCHQASCYLDPLSSLIHDLEHLADTFDHPDHWLVRKTIWQEVWDFHHQKAVQEMYDNHPAFRRAWDRLLSDITGHPIHYLKVLKHVLKRFQLEEFWLQSSFWVNAFLHDFWPALNTPQESPPFFARLWLTLKKSAGIGSECLHKKQKAPTLEKIS